MAGSLSTDVGEPRTATGSRMFLFLARFCSSQRTAKLLLVTNVRDGVKTLHKGKQFLLPVTVRGSRTSVLKLKLPTTTTAKYIKVSANFFFFTSELVLLLSCGLPSLLLLEGFNGGMTLTVDG